MNSKWLFLILLLFSLTATPTGVTAQSEDFILINVTFQDGLSFADGATYNGIVELTVTASYPDGISWIKMVIDSELVKQQDGALLTCSWDTALYSDGAHHIQITAAVNTTFFRYIDFNVFVNNTTTETLSGQWDNQTKLAATGVSATVVSALLGFAFFKSDLADTKKRKGLVAIIGVSIFLVFLIYIWIFL